MTQQSFFRYTPYGPMLRLAPFSLAVTLLCSMASGQAGRPSRNGTQRLARKAWA